MNAKPILLCVLLALPAFGQSVYKCPQPDGTLRYQSTRCPDGTRGRIQIQDNGTVTGVPAADAPAAPEAASLRPGEQRMLEQIQTREKEDRDRAAEYAKAAAIRDHQKAVEEMSAQMHRDHEQKMELMKK